MDNLATFTPFFLSVPNPARSLRVHVRIGEDKAGSRTPDYRDSLAWVAMGGSLGAHTREPIPETRSVLIYAKPFISGGTES